MYRIVVLLEITIYPLINVSKVWECLSLKKNHPSNYCLCDFISAKTLQCLLYFELVHPKMVSFHSYKTASEEHNPQRQSACRHMANTENSSSSQDQHIIQSHDNNR